MLNAVRTVFLLPLLALLCAAAQAADTYTADADHTFASFAFDHLGYSQQRGRFDTVRATVQLDMEQRSGSVEVVIAVASVSTGSTAFNQTLLGSGFFDAAQFPEIRFTGNQLVFDRLDRIERIDGNLTIKGTTRPVTLQVGHFHCMVHPLLRKQACGAHATATIRRSDFGLGKFAPLVGDTVSITVAIEALRTAP